MAILNTVTPLAHRVRPSLADDLVGQRQAEEFFDDFIKLSGVSAILWGPPGTGKTTIANIIRRLYPEAFSAISAVTSGIQEIRKIIHLGLKLPYTPIVFIDEIHRFNKVQQDVLLPHIEDGSIILIGATTENPSFSIIPPLLSRIKIITLYPLSPGNIEKILIRALRIDSILQSTGKDLSDKCIKAIANAAYGDARAALNLLEIVLTKIDKVHIDVEDLKVLIKRPLYHDRSGDAHYEIISALHKSIRAGDVDASVYWLGRMLEAGEDRLYILRRMIRMASEDIGNADPNALRMTIAAKDAFVTLGRPEGDLALYQVAVYLACAPKSNAVYLTEKKVKKIISKTGTPAVPLYLRNAPTRLMQDMGYSKGYIYPHDDPEGALEVAYMPEGIKKVPLYVPKDSGFEKRLKEIIDAREKAKRYRSGPHRRSH